MVFPEESLAQLVKKSSACMNSESSSLNSVTSHFYSDDDCVTCILLLFFHLCPGLPSGLNLSGYAPKLFYTHTHTYIYIYIYLLLHDLQITDKPLTIIKDVNCRNCLYTVYIFILLQHCTYLRKCGHFITDFLQNAKYHQGI
jgi:hypothetical protein